MYKKILIAIVFISGSIFAQKPARPVKEAKPVFREVSNKDVVQSIYPDAAKVEKVNAYWFRVFNNENKIIGFAMSSNTFCKDVKGYNNLTPVMILTDNKWVIKKVALLSNWETLGYVRKLEKKGFFDLWVGKTLKQAKVVHIDGYTGATCTAIAVAKNVDFLLKNGGKILPGNN